MSSLTTRLALKRNDGTDPFLRADFTQNWNKIDQYPGTFIVTSTTRPSWGDAQIGMSIFETDTRREYRFMGGTEWHLVNPIERMPGEITMFGAGVIPAGWLACDGSEKPRSTYADLFAAISIVYGPGNGSTTFNLPNLQSRVPVGGAFGSGYGAIPAVPPGQTPLTARALASSGGKEAHALTPGQLAAHSHTPSMTNAGSHAHGVHVGGGHWHGLNRGTTGGSQNRSIQASATGSSTGNTESAGDHGHGMDNAGDHSHPITIGNTGGNEAHPTMPPFVTVNFIIKV